jgi:hypothetical protein
MATTLLTGACATAPATGEAVPWEPPPNVPPLVSVRGSREDQAVGRDATPLARSGNPRDPWRAAVVEQAVHQIGRQHVRGDRSDCAGFVRAAFRAAGLSIAISPAAASASQGMALAVEGRLHAAPLPGDLAFFHDTYDRNHDGALGDPFSHVALVESAGADGHVSLIHFGSHGVKRLILDLSRPSVHREGAFVFNDYLRVRRAGDPPGTRYLAGELLAGFGTPKPALATSVEVSARAAPATARRRSRTASPDSP